jgi:hypothetical protein
VRAAPQHRASPLVDRGMTSRRTLPAALLLAALLLPASPAAAAPPSCTRGGAALEEASGKVRVVRRALKTTSRSETRRERLSACWAPTGRRVRIATERDFGDDLRSYSRVEIVDGRYVGVVLTGEGGVSIAVTATAFDARRARRLHTTASRCGDDGDDFRGPDDVVFLPRGGMAFTCGALWFFGDAAQQDATQLEPAEARPRSLGLAYGSDSFADRLYWTLADGTIRTRDLL